MLRCSEAEQKFDLVVTPRKSSSRSPMNDHEGLIPANPEFYVVDCPGLHIVSGSNIGPRRQAGTEPGLSSLDRSSCPQCQQVITRCRKIPATSDIPLPTLDPAANNTNSDGASWLSRPYSTPVPEATSTPVATTVQGSISTPTLGRPRRIAFFSRIFSPSPATASQGPTKRITTQGKPSLMLPRYLLFCFSLSGKSLILWKKDSQVLVRIEVETRGSRLLDLTEILPVIDADRIFNIHHVAEGNDWICVLISHNQSLILLVLHSNGLREESTLHSLDEQLEPRALAISPDNSFIAVGFGPRVHLFNYQGCHQKWHVILATPGFTIPAEVKFQAANFSPDNTTLVVATQRYDVFRSTKDDVISTYVWECTRLPPPPQEMGACKMPTDGQGLTSIHHFPALSISLILGASPTPYPLFLPPSSSPPIAVPHTMTEFRIRCACLSPPPNAYIAYMMDVKNKVFRIDLRARSVVQIADVNMERGALTVREEPAAIGVTAEGKVRLFWRQGGGLWIYWLGDGTTAGRHEKTNLRAIWEDAGVGD